MPSVILAGTTTGTALSLTSDTSGELQIRTNNGATTAMTLTTGGNINIPTAGARITGDFSNATAANRVFFQTSTTNSNTVVSAMPNGTGTISLFDAYNSSDPANASLLRIRISSTEGKLENVVTGTGTFLPITINTGGSERLRIDTSGNVGIGTSSPGAKLVVSNGTQGMEFGYSASLSGNYIESISRPSAAGVDMNYFIAGTAVHKFFTAATERMRITSTGDVGIGTNSPSAKLAVSLGATGTGTSALFNTADGTYSTSLSIQHTTTGINLQNSNPFSGAYNNLSFSNTSVGETMRINANGVLLVGTTDANFTSGVGLKFVPNSTTPAMCITTNTAVGTEATYHLFNTNATNNGYRFYVVSNGGIYNFSGNNSNLSDERSKKNIEVAGSYLDKICSIPVKLFNYKDEADGEQRTLGVIAQDVEAVAPEFVNNNGWEGSKPKDGVSLKSIYSTDMMFGMMKAIQELKAELDSVKAELQTLKGA